MSKKTIIIVVVLIVVLVGGLISGYLLLSQNKVSDSQEKSLVESLVEKVVADVSYEDEAGFAFKYPKGIKVNDNTPDDDLHYSLLNLVKGDEEIVITVKDTKETSVENWIKKQTDFTSPTLAGATSLGKLPAKQYVYNSSKLLTVAIDRGVVYLIEGPKDNGYWEEAQTAIAASFIFADQKASLAVEEDNNSVIYEEEEVVE